MHVISLDDLKNVRQATIIYFDTIYVVSSNPDKVEQ